MEVLRQKGSHQAQKAVSIEDKVGRLCVPVANDGVHAPDLEVGRNDFQVGVYPPQIWLLQLHLDMLRYQVDRNHILIPSSHPQQSTTLSCYSANSFAPADLSMAPLQQTHARLDTHPRMQMFGHTLEGEPAIAGRRRG